MERLYAKSSYYLSSSMGFFLKQGNPVSNISVTSEHISSQYGLIVHTVYEHMRMKKHYAELT